MTDPAAKQDAYALLSRPTLELSDQDILDIIENLRARRIRSLTTGKPDKPVAEAKAARKGKVTDEEKAANTARILSQLKLPSIGGN